MIRSFLVLMMLGVSLSLCANTDTPNAPAGLAGWAASFPESIDGVKIYAPVEEDGTIRISDLIDFPGMSQKRIFINMLCDVREKLEPSEELENIDYSGFRVRLRRSSIDEKKAATYNYSVAMQATEEMLSFLVYDISISYREKGIVPRTQSLEKLSPTTNRRHKELLEACVENIARFIDRISKAIQENASGEVSDWSEIVRAKVVKGMTPTDVILIKGRPATIRKSGERTKWMYGNENVVVFTDGKVTTVI